MNGPRIIVLLWLLGALAAVASGGVPRPLAAQDADGPSTPVSVDTARVVLTLAERLQIPWARAMIVRTADDGEHDLIIVTPATTPADLEKALRMLVASYESLGAYLEREVRAHVSPALETPPGADLARLRDRLDDLGRATPLDISEFGMLPSLEIEVPYTSDVVY